MTLTKYDLSSDEALLVLCITREDIRMLTSEWNLSEEDITCVMQRLDATYDQGTDVSMIRGITEELMDERRALRDVSVPASVLQKIMLLAGSEMQRLYVVAEEGGGNADPSWLKKWAPCASYRLRSTHRRKWPVV
ncbi:hypothetical protein [Salmonella enterica]|uniref:hypothetical protein n=1 Tax=Salmonella enterica TaxID=28901 RepID=UPI0021B346E9|nr:hypothetical protein [Salmonella enterica]MCT7202890.1 hypothetical protein [Salmonella enterica subsp. enterica serovar Bovismorbificans]